jgi:SAM-dependent methyltransferase
MGSTPYQDQLAAEAETWCLQDEEARLEKLQRERLRHPKLIRDLLLDQLDTHRMVILEVGGGPTPLSDLLTFKRLIVIDPCTDDYKRYFPCPHHHAGKIEESKLAGMADLVICTNALDHVDDPETAVARMNQALRPGGFMAIMCAENNALTNPHPCHVHNLTAPLIHQWLDADYETVWELTFREHGYRYGWVAFEGKRGQPAFALLLRKAVGYKP